MEKQIEEIRREIILKGKRSPKFQDAFKAHVKSGDEKYTDLDDIDNSGAINLKDAVALNSIIRKWDVKTVFEIGTWFGTSAMIMASAGAKVRTCDSSNYYVGESEDVKYYNGMSNKILRRLKGMKFDMVFIDGRFKNDDCTRISRICKIFFTHDYEKGKKGQRNIREMKKRWHGAKFIKSCEGSSIAGLIK